MVVASAYAQPTRGGRVPKLLSLSFSASSDSGLFLVLSTNLDSPRSRPEAYAALWQYNFDGRVYLFERLLFNRTDRGHAVLNIARDFGVPLFELGADLPQLSSDISAALNQREDVTTWVLLCSETLQRITGLTRENISPIAPGETGTVAGGRDVSCGPPSAATFDPFLDVPCDADGVPLALHSPCNDNNRCTTDCCINGECVNTPKDGCDLIDPCDGSTDPCCGDPCCGDPCCGDPCCGDPCCVDPCSCDPCCVDPCSCVNCDDGDPCTIDSCSGGTCEHSQSVDPCCGVTDPCDAACGDPCLCLNCDDGNECTDDACSGGACANTLVADPCCGVTDPCLCIDCNDGNDCTTDSCSDGICSNDSNCEAGLDCCNGTCCPDGQGCCGNHCCPRDQFCCGDGCCLEGESCCSGVCCVGGEICCESQTCCCPGSSAAQFSDSLGYVAVLSLCTNDCSCPGTEAFCFCLNRCRLSECLTGWADCSGNPALTFALAESACAVGCLPVWTSGGLVPYRICALSCGILVTLIPAIEAGLCLDQLILCKRSANDAFAVCVANAGG